MLLASLLSVSRSRVWHVVGTRAVRTEEGGWVLSF